ncbi:unnamed protein product [Periconia digitata]|uniref:Uncharacterized protein n=1 Tax=Periconia digitata TaxID=1303443 RepID=A0A9W4U810_9PLEO|nr:unnamed protein product [Periconia digitata]
MYACMQAWYLFLLVSPAIHPLRVLLLLCMAVSSNKGQDSPIKSILGLSGGAAFGLACAQSASQHQPYHRNFFTLTFHQPFFFLLPLLC